MQAELEYVSVGCSRTPHAADWSSSGLLAYAAHESIALTREAEVILVKYLLHSVMFRCCSFQEGRRPARVFATLHGHRGRVNCVQWLPQTSASPLELVSGGVDGHVVVWRRGRDAHVREREREREIKSTCNVGFTNTLSLQLCKS